MYCSKCKRSASHSALLCNLCKIRSEGTEGAPRLRSCCYRREEGPATPQAVSCERGIPITPRNKFCAMSSCTLKYMHACMHACGHSASKQYLIATKGTAASQVTLVEPGLRHRQVLGRLVCDLTLVGTGVFVVQALLQSIYVDCALHAPCCLVLCLTSA